MGMESGTLSLSSLFAVKDCIHRRRSLQCSIGMESGTLPLTSPSQRILSEKLRYPCFSQVTGGLRLPSFMPILHQSLHFNDCYSPSLRRFSQVSGSDCPSYRPIIHQSLHLIGFYSSSLRKFASTGGLRLPSSMPILHQSLQFIDCYSLSLRRFSPRLSISKDT